LIFSKIVKKRVVAKIVFVGKFFGTKDVLEKFFVARFVEKVFVIVNLSCRNEVKNVFGAKMLYLLICFVVKHVFVAKNVVYCYFFVIVKNLLKIYPACLTIRSQMSNEPFVFAVKKTPGRVGDQHEAVKWYLSF